MLQVREAKPHIPVVGRVPWKRWRTVAFLLGADEKSRGPLADKCWSQFDLIMAKYRRSKPGEDGKPTSGDWDEYSDSLLETLHGLKMEEDNTLKS